MTEEKQSSQPKEKAPAKALSSGTKLKLAPMKSPAIVLLSQVWSSPNVGIFIDVPIVGKPADRLLIGQYGAYAVEKASEKIYRSSSYGIFNPRMGKDGVECIEAYHDVASDGAPTNLRISLTAKSFKIGAVLANVLAKMQFEPPVSDLSSPLLCLFPRDDQVLRTIASKFCDALLHASIAMVGGKKASFRDDIEKKFAAKYAKNYGKPNFGKAAAAASASAVQLMPEMHAFKMDIGANHQAAAVIIAHIFSHFGTVGEVGNAITLTMEKEGAYYAHRMTANALSNISRVTGMLVWYSNKASRDKLNDASFATVLCIAGIACGLPIDRMIEILSAKTLDIPSIAKQVSDSAIKLKEEKMVKPKKVVVTEDGAAPSAAAPPPSSAPSKKTKTSKKTAAKKKKAFSFGSKFEEAEDSDDDDFEEEGTDEELADAVPPSS